jgi:hypothetical protein
MSELVIRPEPTTSSARMKLQTPATGPAKTREAAGEDSSIFVLFDPNGGRLNIKTGSASPSRTYRRAEVGRRFADKSPIVIELIA